MLEGKDLDVEELPLVDTKELNQGLVRKPKLVLKVGKCHCKEEFLSLVLKTSTESLTKA